MPIYLHYQGINVRCLIYEQNGDEVEELPDDLSRPKSHQQSEGRPAPAFGQWRFRHGWQRIQPERPAGQPQRQRNANVAGLIDHFHRALYPEDGTSSQGNNRRPVADNVRFAQEYEAAFGRSDLHDALRRLVPDTEYSPGIEHRRLLKLPWRDIYTTNWDTLLERTQDQVAEQHYSTVTSMQEIPMASRPRIVKLHGSFPAQFPFIFTEEDYRTYPTKFAPFVNTVQQSMMETVFLLIGFSGDDPNFLNWSGWVRDNLGASAPKIYLAGWLELSPHRRRMLERSNVVPIDLAQHPKSHQWPESLRHSYATEWLLRSLEMGRPYDITSWPTPSQRQTDETRLRRCAA